MRRWVLIVSTLLGVIFLSLPILVLVLHMLESQAWHTLDSELVSMAISLSLVTTSITAIITVLLGTPLAYVLARWRFTGRRLLRVLVELPIVMPPAVAGLALLLTFGRRGFLGATLAQLGISLPFSMGAVIIAQIFVAAPFFIRSAQVGFLGVPREVEDAGRVDGADGLRLFLLVTMPLAMRSLAAGLILSWARALGEFGATILFAGSLQGRTQTMPLLIYNMLERDIDAAVMTGLILVGLALMALLAWQYLSHVSDDELGA
jgi:molybdate transport system permease protein